MVANSLLDHWEVIHENPTRELRLLKEKPLVFPPQQILVVEDVLEIDSTEELEEWDLILQ